MYGGIVGLQLNTTCAGFVIACLWTTPRTFATWCVY